MNKLIMPLAMTAALLSPATQAYTIYGSGVHSCGWWTEEKDKKSDDHYDAAAWVSGYVTGAAAALSEYTFRDTDVLAMVGYMNKWCSENPLKTIEEGAGKLTVELVEKQ